MFRQFLRAFDRPTLSLLSLLPLLLVSSSLTRPARAEILFWPARLDFPAGEGPWSVAIGDLNGDEIPDLAVANRDSNNVAVLLGVGDGTFATADF